MKHRIRVLDFLRYKSPYLLVHVLLVALGLINLYPFLWMIGTSMKAEAEASTHRMSPLPQAKFQLAEDFDLRKILPLAMQPGLDRAEGNDYHRGLVALHSKLTLVDRMQRDGWPASLAKRMGGDMELPFEEILRGLKVHGILEEDAQGVWLSANAYKPQSDRNLSPEYQGLVQRLRDHGSIMPLEYAVFAKTTATESLDHLEQLRRVGMLERLDTQDSPTGPQPRYRLAPGARGTVAQDLLPRQILTLWGMSSENLRRSETRATYAEDRVTVAEYATKYGMADLARAEAELQALITAGWVTDGTWQSENYWVVLKGENFLLRFGTSLLLTAVVVMGTLLVSSMLGYALARLRFPGKFWILGTMIFASILPTEARIIPIFKMLMSINALQSLWGLAAWLISFGVGNALLMAGFFLSLPKEVNEAAEVDGAGVFRTFFDIALPMARPITITVGLFSFLTAWNEFLVPLLCTISRPSLQPLAVAVYNFQAGHPGKWHEINAAASLMIVPVILLFLLVQKHVVKGIAVGAVKG